MNWSSANFCGRGSGVSCLNVVRLRPGALPSPLSPTRVTGASPYLRLLRSFLGGFRVSSLISPVSSYFAIVCARARARVLREFLADAAVFLDIRHRVNNTTQSRRCEGRNIATNCLGRKNNSGSTSSADKDSRYTFVTPLLRYELLIATSLCCYLFPCIREKGNLEGTDFTQTRGHRDTSCGKSILTPINIARSRPARMARSNFI